MTVTVCCCNSICKIYKWIYSAKNKFSLFYPSSVHYRQEHEIVYGPETNTKRRTSEKVAKRKQDGSLHCLAFKKTIEIHLYRKIIDGRGRAN